MVNITQGKIKRAQRVIVYGPEGIGKTTFAASFPRPFFIDTENGTDHLNVTRCDLPDSFEELIKCVEEFPDFVGQFRTLVIDTADRAEDLCIKGVCDKYKKTGIEEFGYGKGYVYVYEDFARLLSACDKVIASGINVVITAHAKMRKFEQPDEPGAYDRWELKLSKQVAPLLKEWADMVLFCNYKTYVVTSSDGTKKGQGGKRVLYTAHHPCWDAKNRHGLPDEMDLDIKGFGKLFEIEPEEDISDIFTPSETPQEKLSRMMGNVGMTEDQLKRLVVSKGHFKEDTDVKDYPDEFLTRWVFPNWDKIVQNIK